LAQIRSRLLQSLLAAVAVASLAFTACGSSEKHGWTPGKPFPRERLKIAILNIDDHEGNRSGYSFAHMQGIAEMQKELELEADQIVRAYSVSDSDNRTVENTVRELIAAGANVIIATSYNHMDVCEALAREFTGVVFANSSGYKFNRTNFTNYFGRIYQARYLSGLVAGLRTQTGRIGYVAARGRENSEVTGGVNAFAIGVAETNPEAKVLVTVIHRWHDPAGEARATRHLVEQGCDVIAQHTNTAAPQIETEKFGIWGIGYHSDMSVDAPRSTVTSVVWNWGVYYKRLARSIIDGSFTTRPYVGGMEDGLVAMTPLKVSLAPEGAVAKVEEARARILSGHTDVFDGELRTNDGATVGVPGGRLNYDQITMDSHWYLENVEEVVP
jgi:basic membrane protein A